MNNTARSGRQPFQLSVEIKYSYGIWSNYLQKTTNEHSAVAVCIRSLDSHILWRLRWSRSCSLRVCTNRIAKRSLLSLCRSKDMPESGGKMCPSSLVVSIRIYWQLHSQQDPSIVCRCLPEKSPILKLRDEDCYWT